MTKTETGLADLLSRGGVHLNVPGNSIREVINSAVKTIPLPKSISPDELCRAVIEREELMSTGTGNGIAIPHPRNPVAINENEQFVSVIFPEKPINWNSPDGKPVDTLLLLVCASAKIHLQTLSAIGFFCTQDEFIKLLGNRASTDSLIGFIHDNQKLWRTK